jgi:hypothetical protein
MNCREFQQSLERCIEQRLAPSDDLARHGQTCSQSECQAAWEDYEILSLAIRDWQASPAPANLVEGVLSGLASSSPAARAPAHSRAPVWAALSLTIAACLVAALVLAIPSGKNPDSSPVAGKLAAPPQPELEQLGSLYAGWMEQATAKVTDTVAFVLPDDESGAGEPASAPGWLENWGQRLQPLEQKVDDAVRQLLDAAPRDQTGRDVGPAASRV